VNCRSVGAVIEAYGARQSPVDGLCPGGATTTTGGYGAWAAWARVWGSSRRRLTATINKLVGIAAPTPHTAPARTDSASSLNRFPTTQAKVTMKASVAITAKIFRRAKRSADDLFSFI